MPDRAPFFKAQRISRQARNRLRGGRQRWRGGLRRAAAAPMLPGMERHDPFKAKLVVDHLGAIEHAELTIRPLTMFFGPNGTNKTWTAYALYGLLRKLRGAPMGPVSLDESSLARLLAVDPQALPHCHVELNPIHDHDDKTTAIPSLVAFPAERKALLTLHRQLAALSLFGSLRPEISHAGPTESLAQVIATERLVAAARDMETALPLPAIDFISMLDTLARRPAHASPDALGPLADRLATHLLGGRLAFVTTVIEGTERALRFHAAHGDLPIQGTHSLLRSLGGLDLYLRHVARPGDVILIDEPEMNAHPATQLAIAELLATMVNAGLRVIVTTHSPYIIDHLHNLIEAARLDPDAQAIFARRFKLGSPDAFISADAVATYHFELDGTVSDVFDRGDRLIDWSTFGQEADEVGNLYTALLAAQRDD